MSHSIPIALQGEQAKPASAPTTAVALPPTAPVVSTVTLNRPTYAAAKGRHWTDRECRLVEEAFRTGGHEAAYKVVPHRGKPAVRGQLQRLGLIPARNQIAVTGQNP